MKIWENEIEDPEAEEEDGGEVSAAGGAPDLCIPKYLEVPSGEEEAHCEECSDCEQEHAEAQAFRFDPKLSTLQW